MQFPQKWKTGRYIRAQRFELVRILELFWFHMDIELVGQSYCFWASYWVRRHLTWRWWSRFGLEYHFQFQVEVRSCWLRCAASLGNICPRLWSNNTSLHPRLVYILYGLQIRWNTSSVLQSFGKMTDAPPPMHHCCNHGRRWNCYSILKE